MTAKGFLFEFSLTTAKGTLEAAQHPPRLSSQGTRRVQYPEQLPQDNGGNSVKRLKSFKKRK